MSTQTDIMINNTNTKLNELYNNPNYLKLYRLDDYLTAEEILCKLIEKEGDLENKQTVIKKPFSGYNTVEDVEGVTHIDSAWASTGGNITMGYPYGTMCFATSGSNTVNGGSNIALGNSYIGGSNIALGNSYIGEYDNSVISISTNIGNTYIGGYGSSITSDGNYFMSNSYHTPLSMDNEQYGVDNNSYLLNGFGITSTQTFRVCTTSNYRNLKNDFIERQIMNFSNYEGIDAITNIKIKQISFVPSHLECVLKFGDAILCSRICSQNQCVSLIDFPNMIINYRDTGCHKNVGIFVRVKRLNTWHDNTPTFEISFDPIYFTTKTRGKIMKQETHLTKMTSDVIIIQHRENMAVRYLSQLIDSIDPEFKQLYISTTANTTDNIDTKITSNTIDITI